MQRPDEDNGVVWCPLDAAERAATLHCQGKSIDKQAFSAFLSDVLPGIAVVDPTCPGTKTHKPKYLVDIDLFVEALLQLLMTEDNSEVDCIIDSVSEGAERESRISLTRFLRLMETLNATANTETLVAEFKSRSVSEVKLF